MAPSILRVKEKTLHDMRASDTEKQLNRDERDDHPYIC
ncbi:hypothetical protein NEOC65_002258 [Neochlamydia sp. AcF65]|nr:hypothetical protein [Neochlamydia sp. AcF65]MBS4169464.1 hypothetical protein [Neochlamydia sp. AcF95]